MRDGAAQRDDPFDALDRATHARCEAWVRARCEDPSLGLFGPESLAWTLVREPAYLLGGVAAVLLQMAHPAVVAGVSTYSTFQTDLLGRIRRTSQALYSLVFGTLDDALGTSRRMHNIHARVKGVIDEPGSPWHGRSYRANEQDLLAWVSMTAALAGRGAFEAFVRPIEASERARDWEDLRRGTVVSGVDPDTLPATREDFIARFHQIAETSPDLYVGDKARAVARVLFETPFSKGIFDRITTTALLPPRLRAMYGLPWGATEQRAFDRRRRGFKLVRALAPAHLRYVPAWHQAQRRVAAHCGEHPALWGRALDAVGARITLPASIRAR